MGVADRKERHKEELKKSILEAAKYLFTEKGFEATSIRNIADKIEYSPATIYLYYKDKNDIIHALHQEGFKLLVSYFATLQDIADPFERLKAMGHRYLQFAFENKDIYKLLFTMEEPMDHLDACATDGWSEGDTAFHSLQQTVMACMEAGYFKGQDPIGVSFAIWSTMHGICSLHSTGHLYHVAEAKGYQSSADGLIQLAFQSLIEMLQKQKS